MSGTMHWLADEAQKEGPGIVLELQKHVLFVLCIRRHRLHLYVSTLHAST